MKKALIFLFSLVFVKIEYIRAQNQDSFPVLTGIVDISITTGSIECDFTLRNIPRIEDYVIRINSGMNIRYLKDLSGNDLLYYERAQNDTLTSESIGYYFPGENGSKKPLPDSLRFRYVGRYPVFKEGVQEYSIEDWKGNIAFNGYSVRSDGRQSAWYPVLYDMKKDILYDKLQYNIEVNCPDCNAIYVSGSLPVKSSKAQVRSREPSQLTIFCGQYEIKNINGTYFLNPDINDRELNEFGRFTGTFKLWYEKKLQIPYRDTITYIQTTPTSEYNAWMFVSYPAIVNIGRGEYGLRSFLDTKQGDFFKPYMAHELAHFYFGAYTRFNSVLGDMISEGFAEYLSLCLTKELLGDSVYNDRLKTKIRKLRHFQAIPWGRVKSKEDYADRELYVYYYAPLVLLAVEKEIGTANMWKWIKKILTTKAAFTNYAFLEQTLGVTINNRQQLETIRSLYFDSSHSVENALKTIGQ